MADTELTTLLSVLNSKRRHIQDILEGLDEEALRLRRPIKVAEREVAVPGGVP
ncbi:hypothetical protein [Streptomyces sp. NPDC017940]|uniref:hypothetical protein n=1 Tax=Streptomyces sp. NPDC017940 TaxID=3365017 RepID=UPI0037B7B577